MNLIFIDVETFGLNPYDHPIIDIAMISTTREGEIINEYSSKIKPSKLEIECADQKAIEVNGFKPELWSEAKSKKEVNKEIQQIFAQKEKYIPIGWNIGFDLEFLKIQLYLYDLELYHHPLDLMSMVWMHKYCLIHGNTTVKNPVCDSLNCSYEWLMNSEKLSLKNYCKMLGVEIKNEHTALGDVKMMIECYRRLI